MIYNYKDDELVQDVILKNCADIVDDIVEEYVGLRRNDYLAVYAPVYIAKDIIYLLMNESEIDLFIDEEADLDLLEDDENIVIVSVNFDSSVSVEDAYGYEHIKRSGAVLTYYYDGLSQKDLELVKKSDEWNNYEERSILVFGFEEDDFENESDMEVMVSVDDKGVPHGFSVTWAGECGEGCNTYQSYSVYSTCSTRVAELAELFGIDL